MLWSLITCLPSRAFSRNVEIWCAASAISCRVSARPRRTAVQAQAVPPDVFTHGSERYCVTGTHPDGQFKEIYQRKGRHAPSFHAWPGGSPGASSVVDYLRQFFSFDFQWNAFAFHSDELCGHHKGHAELAMCNLTGNHIGDPHVHTVNGTSYDFQAVGEFTLLRDGDEDGGPGSPDAGRDGESDHRLLQRADRMREHQHRGGGACGQTPHRLQPGREGRTARVLSRREARRIAGRGDRS